MSDDILHSLEARHVWHPFTQAAEAPPAALVTRAEGVTLHLADGRSLLDMVSSWWTNLHGHAHPAIARAVGEQAARLEHVIFADFTHEPAIRLAAGVAGLLPGDLNRVFFSDNGSTAVEVALKMALQYWANLGQDRRRQFIAFDGAYHGDTVGAMSPGRTSGYFRAWEQMLFPVHFAPTPATWMDDDLADEKEAKALAALDRLLDQHGSTLAAVILEPLVQGASGMNMTRPSFLKAVADKVRAAGALLILDEVMTGFGRTGPDFACQAAGVVPDFVCLSKGLSGGFLPIALTVTRDAVHDAFLGKGLERAFLHGHSFTANPLGCAAALASLELFDSAQCRTDRARIEALHRRRLEALAGHPLARRRRQAGTIAALDMGEGDYGSGLGQAVKRFALDRGVLLRPLGPVAYLLPPYVASDEQLDRAWDVLEQALDALQQGRLTGTAGAAVP